jgi:hypothetical protein
MDATQENLVIKFSRIDRQKREAPGVASLRGAHEMVTVPGIAHRDDAGLLSCHSIRSDEATRGCARYSKEAHQKLRPMREQER